MEDIIGAGEVIKKEEFVRLITGALYHLGFERAGAALEEESGIQLHSPVVDLFRKHVLEGNWDESIITLHEIGIEDENAIKSSSFLILRQKYFELLESGRVMDALETLRNEITPLNVEKTSIWPPYYTHQRKVHKLCLAVVSHYLFPSVTVFATVRLRTKLLDELQKLWPPDIMVDKRRLEYLVELALYGQHHTW